MKNRQIISFLKGEGKTTKFYQKKVLQQYDDIVMQFQQQYFLEIH